MDYSFYFLQSNVLLLLLTIPLLLYYFSDLKKKSKQGSEVPFSSLTLLGSILALQKKSNAILRYIIMATGLACLIIALAGPILTYKNSNPTSAVVLVFDTSNSMIAQDMLPDRLSAARDVADDFLNTMPGDIAIGFLTFNGSVRVQNELKRGNLQAVQENLRKLDETQLGPETATGDALLEASTMIERYRAEQKDTQSTAVLFITDGAATRGSDPLEAAAALGRKETKVFPIGIGTEAGTEIEIRLSDGTTQSVKIEGLNTAELNRIAELSGGVYTNVIDVETFADILNTLSRNDLKLFEIIEVPIKDQLLLIGIVLEQIALAMGYIKKYN